MAQPAIYMAQPARWPTATAVGGLQHFSVSPSPLGPNWVFDLGWTGLGLGLWGFWDKVLGTGLDNIQDDTQDEISGGDFRGVFKEDFEGDLEGDLEG